MTWAGRIWRMLRCESGNATVEFVIALPVVLTLWFAASESGLMMMRGVMLESSVHIAMRELRLGHIVAPTHRKLKEEICKHTVIMADCMKNMLIELQPINTTTWVLPTLQNKCVDRAQEINPIDDASLAVGAPSEIMLVRVCAIVDPIFPQFGLGFALRINSDAKGGYGLFASSAFVNEP